MNLPLTGEGLYDAACMTNESEVSDPPEGSQTKL